MSSIANSTVLITGGASGIGKIMARLCGEAGAARILIWDRDRPKTEETVAEFRAAGHDAHAWITDVSDVQAIRAAAREVLDRFGGIDILVNNAGIIVGGTFSTNAHEDIRRTLDINTAALMHIALEFLPGMIERKRGHIVNIASAAGMIAVPKMSVYVASKHAVVGWSESLRLELEAVSRHLHVTTVTPSYISTGMFEGVRSPVIRLLKPEVAARRIIRGIQRNRIFVRMPRIVYFLPFLAGLLPRRWMDVIVGKWFGFHRSMDHFKGKNPS